MPDQCCNDLQAQSCSSHLLASTQMLSRLPVSRGCRRTAERRRSAPIAASCSGLTQQGLSPLNALHREPISANLPQHAFLTSVQRSQRPSQVYGRDVRAFIRAPVIPALETQPYREGEDKASQLQAGKCMNSTLWNPFRHLHAVTCSSLGLSVAAELYATSLMLHLRMTKSSVSHALLNQGQKWQSLCMTGLQRTLGTAVSHRPNEALPPCSAAEVARESKAAKVAVEDYCCSGAGRPGGHKDTEG